MKFKSLAVVKHPRDLVWKAMRDELPEMVPYLDEIEGISVQSCRDEGSVREIVNVWKAAPPIPRIVIKAIGTSLITWTDTARWDNDTFVCRWVIEPELFKKFIVSEGSTTFVSAMGGRGTRITFEGDIQFRGKKLPGIPVAVEGAIADGVNGFVQNLIPKNFRTLAAAVSKHLESRQA